MRIHTLDLQFQGLDRSIAAYLVQGPDGYVLVETGPMSTLDTLHERLRGHGLSAADIGHVLVTHIHLDHAGAAGWWARQGATVYVHQVGAAHLIDPSRLWQSAARIYGDDMESLWGQMLPAPENRIVALNDGDEVEAAGLTFTAWDTPGHAWHHHLYQLGDVGFSGDAAGVRLVPDEWVSLPAPPPEYDLGVWRKTVKKIASLDLDAFYLTHFGRVDDTVQQLQQLDHMLVAATAFVEERIQEGLAREALVEAYRTWNREKASEARTSAEDFVERYEAANPLYMSVDGITRYLRKRAEAAER